MLGGTQRNAEGQSLLSKLIGLNQRTASFRHAAPGSTHTHTHTHTPSLLYSCAGRALGTGPSHLSFQDIVSQLFADASDRSGFELRPHHFFESSRRAAVLKENLRSWFCSSCSEPSHKDQQETRG